MLWENSSSYKLSYNSTVYGSGDVFTSISLAGSAIPVVAVANKVLTIRDDAMHIIILHWRTREDNETELNPGTGQSNNTTDDFFVVVERYIRPSDTGSGNVSIYAEATEIT